MHAVDRVAYHRDLAIKFSDGLKRSTERGAVVLPDDVVLADDMVLRIPLFSDTAFPYGQTIKALGLSYADALTLEMEWYWHKIPGYGVSGDIEIIAGEEGWAQHWMLEGTAENGQHYKLHEAAFIRTNERGEMASWEAFVDWSEVKPKLELLSGRELLQPPTLDEWFGIFGEYLASRQPV